MDTPTTMFKIKLIWCLALVFAAPSSLMQIAQQFLRIFIKNQYFLELLQSLCLIDWRNTVPKKVRKELMVSVMFEPSRIKDTHMAIAYKALISPVKKTIEHNKIKNSLPNKNIAHVKQQRNN